ncbi:hypothetical protein [Schleiferilactobacillus harbinensis]|uniref:hypothetical protein n=1 Tax=Schleiferilactobacillus harbinensis TaxID=304207 RepID=UPI0011716319|nr:hypothetical protein [Schleiferilactobacillus harbinensis]GEK06747.1 hypothetical protein LHA01_19860 [Schleiferilactobacillus harbinensis]
MDKQGALEAMSDRLDSIKAQLNYINNDLLTLTDTRPDPKAADTRQLFYIDQVAFTLKLAVPMLDTIQTDMEEMSHRLTLVALTDTQEATDHQPVAVTEGSKMTMDKDQALHDVMELLHEIRNTDPERRYFERITTDKGRRVYEVSPLEHAQSMAESAEDLLGDAFDLD